MFTMSDARATSGHGSGQIAEALLSLKFAIALGMVVAARYAWLLSHAEKWDTPAQMPALILCELPMVICLAALLVGDNSKRDARSAGLASGMALTFCVGVLPLGCETGLRIWDSRPVYLVEFEHFLPVCALTAVYTIAAAWRYRRNNRTVFSAYAGVGVGCFVGVAVLLSAASIPGSGEEKEKASFIPAVVAPYDHIRAVAACLIRHRFLHPQEGFPSDLSAITPDWNCSEESSDLWALHGNRIFYSAVDHSGSGFGDFRLESIPADRGKMYVEVSASDKRGEVFVFRGLTATAAQRKAANEGGHFSVQTVDFTSDALGHLLNIRGHIKAYMAAHDPANAPASLDGVVDEWELDTKCDSEDSAQDRVIGRPVSGSCSYRLTYLLPSVTPTNTFAISMECVAYGARCLRSYFLDYDGNIHATPEPRAATDQDPGLLPCETMQVCNDPVWTASEQASDWTFTKANLLNLIHSTVWW